jgi:adenine-specific DNA-methyltransferase
MKKRAEIISKSFRVRNRLTIFNGDCLAFLRDIPDRAAQLVVTSPPYNVGKEYEKRMPLDKYLAWQSLVIDECVRITKPGGSICWQVGHHVMDEAAYPLDILLYPLFAKHRTQNGLVLRNRIVWHFEHGLHCKTRFSGRHETILWFTKGENYFFNLDAVRVPQKYPGKRAFQGAKIGAFSSNPLGKNPGDVWVVPNVKANHVEKTGHPCQFPVELPERLVLSLTRTDDLVVDPFLGSGTSAVAAVLHNRRFAGAELLTKYTKIACNRLQLALAGRLVRRPYGKPVYQPSSKSKLTINPFIKLVA